VDIEFESQPEDGSDEENALLGLIGPLAPRAACRVEGKLGRMVWERLTLFRQEFERLAQLQ